MKKKPILEIDNIESYEEKVNSSGKYVLEGVFTEFSNCTCHNYRHMKYNIVDGVGSWDIPKCSHQLELEERQQRDKLIEKRKRVIDNLLNKKED